MHLLVASQINTSPYMAETCLMEEKKRRSTSRLYIWGFHVARHAQAKQRGSLIHEVPNVRLLLAPQITSQPHTCQKQTWRRWTTSILNFTSHGSQRAPFVCPSNHHLARQSLVKNFRRAAFHPNFTHCMSFLSLARLVTSSRGIYPHFDLHLSLYLLVQTPSKTQTTPIE